MNPTRIDIAHLRGPSRYHRLHCIRYVNRVPSCSVSAPRTAIVTGASSGIGAATAALLGRTGWRVALGARRVERLELVAKQVEAEGGAALAHHLDVTDPGS